MPLGTIAEDLNGQGGSGSPQSFAKGDPKKLVGTMPRTGSTCRAIWNDGDLLHKFKYLYSQVKKS